MNQSFLQQSTLRLSLFLIPLSIALPGGLAQLGLCFLFLSCLCILPTSLKTWQRHQAPLFASLFFYLLLSYTVLNFGFSELQSLYSLGLIQFPLTIILLAFVISTNKLDKSSNSWLFLGIISATGLIFLSGFLQNIGIIPTSKPSIGFYEKGSAFYRSTGFLPHTSMYSLAAIAIANAAFFLSGQASLNKYRSPLLLASMASILFTAGRASFLILFVICTSYLLWSIKSLNFRKKIQNIVLALLIITASISMFKDHNPTLYRMFGGHEIQATHKQRFSEVELAINMIKKQPMGYSLQGSAAAGKKHLQEMTKNSSWEFKEWRGIHNYYLALTLWWGFPGVLFYLFFAIFPLALAFIKRNWEAGFYTLFFTGSYLVYAATDSVLYPEIASAVAMISLLPFLITPETHLKTKSSHLPLIISTCFLIAIAATSIRSLIIHSTTIYSYHIDNPSEDLHWKLNYNNQIIPIPPDGHYVIHRTSPIEPLTVINQQGETHTITHQVSTSELSWNRYLVTLEPNTRAYFLETFKFNENSQQMELKPLSLTVKAFTPYLFPAEVSDRAREFLESPLPNYNLAFQKTTEGVKSSLGPRITRSTDTHRLLEQCWEPLDVILGEQDLGKQTCSINKHWNSYNLHVYKNLIRFVRSF